MFTNMIHGGAAPNLTESVYYTGTDTLKEGYALCFDFNAADVNSENVALTAINVGEECWNDARRVLVEEPQEGNKMHFAGVVAKESDGMTGPGWVTIHRPGSICNVYAASNCDHEEGSGYSSGQILNFVAGASAYQFEDGGFMGCGAAMVLQDVDRSSTAGLVMAELMTGPPTGGIIDVDGIAATGSVSAIISMVPVWHGEYRFSDGAAASAGVIISTNILAAAGNCIGKKFKLKGDAALISTAVSIVVSTVAKACYSTYALAATSALCAVSADGDYFTFEFDGAKWRQISGHEAAAT